MTALRVICPAFTQVRQNRHGFVRELPGWGRCGDQGGKMVNASQHCAGCQLRPGPVVEIIPSEQVRVNGTKVQVAPADEVERRRAVCGTCPANQGIAEKMGTVRVKCSACTNCEGGRSLTAAGQACPVGKW